MDLSSIDPILEPPIRRLVIRIDYFTDITGFTESADAPEFVRELRKLAHSLAQ
jgi:hypothetical protein